MPYIFSLEDFFTEEEERVVRCVLCSGVLEGGGIVVFVAAGVLRVVLCSGVLEEGGGGILVEIAIGVLRNVLDVT